MAVDVPANSAIDVVFARNVQAVFGAGLSDPAVVIIPDPNNWNDDGRRLFAFVRIFKDGQLVAQNEPIRFMFAGLADTHLAIKDLLDRLGAVVRIEQADQLYCSLLPNPGAYHNFVQRLGFDHAVSALRKMGDAVIVRIEGRDQARLDLMDSEAFYVSILRADQAYAALRRGGRYLRRVLPAPVEDAAKSFVMFARLPIAPNPYQLAFNFEPDIIGRDRVTVLIGRNGVGKTQLLRHLILKMGGDYAQDGGLAGEVRLLPSPQAQRVLMFSSVTSDPYPEAIPPWQGVDYEYFSMTAEREQGSDALLQALIECRKDYRQLVIGGQALVRADLLERLLRRMQLWEGLYFPLRAPREPVDHFQHLVRVWGNQRYLLVSTQLGEMLSLRLVREIDWSASPVVFGEHGPRHLSSGELAMFRFTAQAVAAIEQGSLLLFDEPETHLHPNYVSDFMEILQDLLEATSSSAIIATHSAYVVREVPRERVNVLSIIDDEVQVNAPRLQTFGASIDTISQFVFGDTNMSHRFHRILSAFLDGPGRDLTIEQIIQQFGDQLNPESLSYLAELKRGRANDGQA